MKAYLTLLSVSLPLILIGCGDGGDDRPPRGEPYFEGYCTKDEPKYTFFNSYLAVLDEFKTCRADQSANAFCDAEARMEITRALAACGADTNAQPLYDAIRGPIIGVEK